MAITNAISDKAGERSLTMNSAKKLLTVLASQGFPLPLSVDFSTLADGSLPAYFTGSTWSIASGKVINTPTLGSNLLVQGGFDAVGDWQLSAPWSINLGKATKEESLAVEGIYQTKALAYNWYIYGYDVVDRASGSICAQIGTQGVGNVVEVDGTYIESLLSAGALTTRAYLYGSADYVGSVDNALLYILSTPELFATIPTTKTEVICELAINTANKYTSVGLVMSLDSIINPKNFVLVFIYKNRVQAIKCVDGVYSGKQESAFTFIEDKILKCVKDGTNYKYYYNETLINTLSVTDAGVISNKIHGIFSTDPRSLIGTYNVI